MAASRNERVIGRTNILNVSIITRAGARAFGALLGVKWARVIFGLNWNPDRTRPSHSGSPIVKVNASCLEPLNIYGISPHRLNITSHNIRVEIIGDIPKRLVPVVVLICWCINADGAETNEKCREGFIAIGVCSRSKIKSCRDQKNEGEIEVNANLIPGSNDEKISSNILCI